MASVDSTLQRLSELLLQAVFCMEVEARVRAIDAPSPRKEEGEGEEDDELPENNEKGEQVRKDERSTFRRGD